MPSIISSRSIWALVTGLPATGPGPAGLPAAATWALAAVNRALIISWALSRSTATA